MKKLYLLLVTLFAAIAVNATTLTGEVYKWDSANNKAVLGDEKIQAEVSIDNGVVSFTNFFGSGLQVDVTVKSSSATHNLSAGTHEGTFNLGSYGTYSDIYLYAGNWSYDDFDYYVEDGEQILHFGAYFENDWYDIYFTLPEDFEPYNPYANLTPRRLNVSYKDITEQVTAYKQGNDYVITGLFGLDVTYTIKDGKASSTFKSGWISTSFTYNGKANSYVYSYGSKYLSYNAETKILQDYIWLYESNVGFNFTIDLNNPNVQVLSSDGTVEYTEYVPRTLNSNGSITLTGLFGTESLTYSVSSAGKVSSDFDGWIVSNNYVYNDVANGYVSGYGDKYASYDSKYELIQDRVYFLGAKVARDFKFDASDGSPKFETTIYKWNNATQSGVEADETIMIKGSIDGNVITLPNFLGSNQEVVVTVYNDNTAYHNQSAGKYTDGTYSFGSFGDYGCLQFYAGDIDSDYTGFSYEEEDGVKTLHFGAYAYADDKTRSGDWFDIYLTLPDDFTTAAKPDPYEGLESRNLTVVFYDGKNYAAGTTETITTYFDGNKVILAGLFGTKKATYTIGEDGSITSSLNGWISSTYTYNGTTNSYVYSYGSKYLSYNASTKTITDYIWLYESNTGFYFTITLPQAGTAKAYIWDDDADDYAETPVDLNIEYTIDNGVVTLNNFLGSSYSPSFTILETGKVTNDGTGYADGTFTIGDLALEQLYLKNNSYVTQSYSDVDGVKTLTVETYVGDEYVKFVITLPESFTPQELEKNATIYAANADGEETSEGTRTHMETSVSGSVLTVSNPFNTGFTFPFTLRNDGSVECTYGLGGFTKTFTYNDKTYARLYDYGRSYDVEKKLFRWQVGFEVTKDAGDIEYYNVYIQLPDDFEASEPQVIESVKSILYSVSESGKYSQITSSTAKIDVKHVEDGRITLTSALGKTVNIAISWDEAGAVTVDGKFTSQYYTIGRDYYSSITIDAANSKYVKNEQDEYIDLAVTTGAGYYGGAAYENAVFRIYIVKTSPDINTTTLYEYEFNTEENDYGEGESSSTMEYTVTNGRVNILDFLGSDLGITVHFFEADESGDGTVETSLKAGTYEGTFSALGNTYSKLTYAGDDDAYWYKEGRSKYCWILVTLDDQPVVLEFSVPNGVTYDKPYSDFTWDVYDWSAEKYTVNDETIKGYYEDGTITLPDFAGSGKEVTLTLYEDDTIVVTYDGTELKKAGNSYYYKVNGEYLNGDFTLGEATYGQLQVSKIFYDIDSNNDSSSHYFGIQAWALENASSETKTNIAIYITVPDDFKAKEYEKNVEIHSVVDGVESEEGNKVHWDVTFNGSVITIKNPFSSSGMTFAYTMQNDGTVAADWEVGGFFTKTFKYEGFNYARFYEYARSYDVEKKIFKWEIGLEVTVGAGDIDYFTVYIQAPDDFEAAAPKVMADYKTEIVVDSRNGRDFIESTKNTSAEISDIANNSITITSLLGASVSIPVSWTADGTVNVSEESINLSNWLYIADDYYRSFSFTASDSKYVKNDEDEYIELSATFPNGYSYKETAVQNIRIYLAKTSADITDELLSIYLSEYDEAGEEKQYETLPHYYSVEEGKLIIKNILDSDNNLEVSYFNNNTVETNLQAGSNSGVYYAFNQQFNSLDYAGDDATVSFGEEEDDAVRAAAWYVYNYQGYTYNYTLIYISLDGKNYGIDFYQPDNVAYNTSGVKDITVDGNGAVEYYNLQGVRVNNPANGIYIRRQGNKVSKVLVK